MLMFINSEKDRNKSTVCREIKLQDCKLRNQRARITMLIVTIRLICRWKLENRNKFCYFWGNISEIQ